MPDPNPDPNANPNPNPNPDPNPGAKWFEALPEFKADATLGPILSKFENQGAAFKALGQTAPTFGEKWREDLVASLPEAERPAEMARLQRYATPKAFFEADRQAHQKLRSGEVAKAPGKDATPEQVAAYRQANGIPEKSTAYFENLPDGLVIGEDDLPIFQSVGEVLHAVNAPPAVAHAVVGWYNKFAEEQQAARLEADGTAKAEATAALRADFGADYSPNMNILRSYLGTLPKEVAAALEGARAPDGTAIMNMPDVVKALVGQARELGITSTIIGAGGGPGGQAIDDELKTIRERMKKDPKGYQRDEAMQKRYRDLLDAQMLRDSRGKTKAA